MDVKDFCHRIADEVPNMHFAIVDERRIHIRVGDRDPTVEIELSPNGYFAIIHREKKRTILRTCNFSDIARTIIGRDVSLKTFIEIDPSIVSRRRPCDAEEAFDDDRITLP